MNTSSSTNASTSASPTSAMHSSARGWMIAALAAALLARAGAWLLLRNALFTGIPGFIDAVHAARIARLLAGSFPENHLPAGSPAYPYLGALLGSVTGGSTSGILLLQALAGIGVVVLIAWAFAPLLSARGRWIAALLYAVHPVAIILELRLQPFVFALLLLLPALRWIFFDGRARLSRLVPGGAALGIGFLLWPLPFILVAAAGIVHLLRLPRARTQPIGQESGQPSDAEPTSRRRGWGPAMALTVSFVLLPLLFCAGQATLPHGAFTWNWTDAHSFWRTLQPDTYGTARSSGFPAWQDYETARTFANETQAKSLDEKGLLGFYRGRALQSLAEHPLRWIGNLLARALFLLSRPELPDPVSVDFLLRRSAVPFVWGLYLFPLFLTFAFLGIWSRRDRPEMRLLFLPLAALVVTNLIGSYSFATRLLLVVAALPAVVSGVEGLPALRARLRAGERPARVVAAAALVLLVVSFLDPAGAHRRFEDSSEDLREGAIAHLRRGDFGVATNLLRQAIRENPANPLAHAGLGEILTRQELAGAARAEYEASLEAAPGNEAGLYGLAEVHRAEGSFAVAESLMTQLVQAHPNHPLYLNQLATILLMRGDFSKARELLRKAVRISPDYQVAWTNLRAADEAQRRASTQVLPEELSRAMDPEIVRIGSLAAQANERKDSAAADSLTREAIVRWPDNYMVIYMRGAFLLNSGRAQEALDPLMRVARAIPGRGITTAMVAQALVATGRREEAIAFARENLAKAPDSMNRRSIENLLQELGAN